ncbi:hypothetical protein LIER_07006 [Lithospermum erythrorhizon]|uniref:Aminotransferase-like plant mobile domain-containing protein n=1 Tax=Lithospermum erythrorhizon TaxID=34254 RepID=A0AAV3P6N5_LITER
MKAFVECWSPSTNTLLLPHGEVSISLWDLYKLGGLPVANYLMDESSTGPLTATSSRAGSSSLPFYPIGPIHGSRSVRSLRVFKLLRISSSLAEEVYYAVFLSCWLCTFALPLDVSGSIRPSVFKMASCMASGKIVTLPIPVLVSIYTLSRLPSILAILPCSLSSWVDRFLSTHLYVSEEASS